MPLILAFAGVVYARAREEAHRSLRDRLRLQAETLAGLIEFDGEKLELEVSFAIAPEYEKPAGGAYFVIQDAQGEVFCASPSLGGEALPPPPAWKPGGLRYEELENGPWGRPCLLLTLAFLAGVDTDGEQAVVDERRDPSIPEVDLRFQVQVAMDTAGRDRSLASLAVFLAVAGALAAIAALLGGAYLARRLMRPVRQMTETARRLGPDRPGQRLEPDEVVEELHSLATTLNEALDRLDQAIRQQRRFTADASHELRTPTAILLSNAQLLLRRSRSEEEYRQGLEQQLRTARRLAALIDDLLTLARADTDGGRIERRALDLAEVARSVCREHSPLAEEKGISLSCDASPAVPVAGDPKRLTELAANLVDNALAYVPRDGHVDVRVRTEGSRAILTVEDDGPGIRPEHQQHIFERFYRVEGGPGGGGRGTGLGLSIVAWIARAHGGEATVASEPGRGAIFRVTLPLLLENAVSPEEEGVEGTAPRLAPPTRRSTVRPAG